MSSILTTQTDTLIGENGEISFVQTAHLDMSALENDDNHHDSKHLSCQTLVASDSVTADSVIAQSITSDILDVQQADIDDLTTNTLDLSELTIGKVHFTPNLFYEKIDYSVLISDYNTFNQSQGAGVRLVSNNDGVQQQTLMLQTPILTKIHTPLEITPIYDPQFDGDMLKITGRSAFDDITVSELSIGDIKLQNDNGLVIKNVDTTLCELQNTHVNFFQKVTIDATG